MIERVAALERVRRPNGRHPAKARARDRRRDPDAAERRQAARAGPRGAQRPRRASSRRHDEALRRRGRHVHPRDRLRVLHRPETYAPLEIVSTQIVAARPDDPEPAARRERRIIQRWVFQRFERLPLTKNTSSLLRMHVTSALSRAPSRARTHHFLPFPAAPASALISSDRFTTSQSRSATYGKDESR